eukprot:TCONS_00062059-protein
MEFKSPECVYCSRTYSKFNEPIYIVCLCEQSAKYAHGSCFRGYLSDHSFGVCGHCFTKTRIVTDGYKPFSEWKVKWKPFCGFWKRFNHNNKYSKIVYCHEVQVNKHKKKITYEDVPSEIPWKNEIEVEEETNTLFEIPGVVEKQHSLDEGDGSSDNALESEPENRQINRIPTVFKPRGYPFVKRQQEDTTAGNLESSFEYYMNSSNRGSFRSQRNFYDNNSIYTITTETNDSPSEYQYSASEDDNKSTVSNQNRRASKLRTIGRSFMKKLTSERSFEEASSESGASRRPSNNNTVQQFYTISELQNTEEKEEVAVLPRDNDIIYMHSRTNSNLQEDYWGMNHQEDVNADAKKKKFTKSRNKMKGSASSNSTSSTASFNNDSSTKLYGVSTNMFRHNSNTMTDAPEPQTSFTTTRISTGTVDKERQTNLFYAP